MRCSVTIRCEMQTRRREFVTSSLREAEKVVFHVKKVSRSTLKNCYSIWVTLSWGVDSIRTKTATLYTETYHSKISISHAKHIFLRPTSIWNPQHGSSRRHRLSQLTQFHSDKFIIVFIGAPHWRKSLVSLYKTAMNNGRMQQSNWIKRPHKYSITHTQNIYITQIRKVTHIRTWKNKFSYLHSRCAEQ
jgi:hypothetical protein